MLQLTCNVAAPAAIAECRVTDRRCEATCGDLPLGTTGRSLPAHLIRNLPRGRSALSDPLSQRIAHLLRLHPRLNDEYRDVDLRTLSMTARRQMYSRISERLGIPTA